MPTEDARDALLALKFVGPATADVLAAEDISPEAFERKSISHSQLVAAGVNPGVAARIRREHSLQWSFEGGEDLDQRAEQVRGLKDDEREWVAKSYGEADTSADGSGDATAEEAAWQAEGPVETEVAVSAAESDEEAAWREQSWPNGDGDSAVEHEEQAWREQSAPTPLTELEGIDEDEATLLSRAGVTSVRSLATAHVERVADSLGVSTERVEAWRDAAREYAD